MRGRESVAPILRASQGNYGLLLEYLSFQLEPAIPPPRIGASIGLCNAEASVLFGSF